MYCILCTDFISSSSLYFDLDSFPVMILCKRGKGFWKGKVFEKSFLPKCKWSWCFGYCHIFICMHMLNYLKTCVFYIVNVKFSLNFKQQFISVSSVQEIWRQSVYKHREVWKWSCLPEEARQPASFPSWSQGKPVPWIWTCVM